MAWPLSQDYNEAVQNPRSSFSDPELRDGQPTLNPLGLPIPRSGNFADVYEFVCPATQARWAVKCFTRKVTGLRERYSEISRHLQDARLPFTVDFQYLEQGIRIRGQWYPILKMRWVEGLLLNEFVRDNLDKPALLQSLSQIWLRMSRRLREADAAHCDLQHGNVLLVPGSKNTSLAVKLIDYDGMFVPALARSNSGEVGHANYQHPLRAREGTYNLEVDRVPLLVVATALRGLIVGGRGLWDRHDNGDNLLFRETDLRDPSSSLLFKELRQLSDPLLQTLVGHLSRACQGKLDSAPLLEEVLPEEKPPAPTRAAARAQGAVTTTPTTTQAVDWDFTESGAPARPRRKQGGVPVLSWVAGGAAVLVLAAVAIFFATRKGGDDSPKEPAVAENRRDTKPDKRPPKDRDKPPPDGDIKPPPKDKDPIKPPDPPGDPPETVVDGQVLPGPRAAVHGAVFSRDGRVAVAADAGGMLHVWDMVKLQRVSSWPGFVEVRYRMALTPDAEKLLCVNNSNSLQLVDLKTGQVSRTFDKNSAFVFCVAVSPDGKHGVTGGGTVAIMGDRATAKDSEVYVWDLQTGKRVGAWEGHTAGVLSLAFRPDGSKLVSLGRDGVRVWEASSGKELRFWRLPVQGGRLSPDGRQLLTTRDLVHFVLWDVDSEQELGRFTSPGGVYSLDFVGDGRLILCYVGYRMKDGRQEADPEQCLVRLWDAKAGKELRLCKGHTDVIHGVAGALDGRRALSFSEDKTLRLWDLTKLPAPAAEPGPAPVVRGEARLLGGKEEWANCAAFSPDGRLLAVGYERPGAVCLWDVTSGKEVHRFEGLPHRASSVAFSPNGKTVFANWGFESSRGWEVATGREAGQLSPGWLLSPSGRFRASVDPIADKLFLRLWSAGTSGEYHRFPVNDNANLSFSFTPDESRLAILGHRGMLEVFDLKNKRLVCRFDVRVQGRSSAACIAPDGRSVLVSYPTGELRLWDLGDKKPVRTFTGDTGGARALVFSAGGTRAFSSAADGSVRVWDVATGQALTGLKGPTRSVNALTLSPDGRQLAAAGPDGIFLWKVSPGEAVVVKPPVDPPLVEKDKRHPVPDKEALTAAEKELHETFKDEYAAKDLTQWQQLAGKLRDFSNEIPDKPALRYVALRDSRNAWILSGNLAWSLRMAMTMNRDYRVNTLEVKCEGLEAAKKSGDIRHIQRDLAVTCLALFEQALDEDDYALAARFLALARTAAAAAKDTALVTKAGIADARLKKTREEYAKVKLALQKLVANPDDRAACLAVGTFLCWKGDWEEGLPLLKKSGDAELTRLVNKDLADPTDAAGRGAVGIFWMAHMAKGSDLFKAACKRRAAYWFREALPGLNAAERAKLDPHLKSVFRDSPLLQEPWPHLVLDDAVIGKDSFRLNDWGSARTRRSYRGGVEVSTKRAYRGGVEVTVVARTEKDNLRLCAGRGAAVVFNYDQQPGGLRLHRPDNLSVDWGTLASTKPLKLKPNQWYTIRWRLTTVGMKLWVDGDLVFEEDHPYDLSAKEPVAVESFDSAIDVKSFVVKRIR